MSEKEGVGVSTLIGMLRKVEAQGAGECQAVVACDRGVVPIGPHPSVPVTGVHAGIDWDRGRVFVDVGQRVAVAGPEFDRVKKSYRITSETIGWIGLAIQNRGLSSSEKLLRVESAVGRLRQRHESGELEPLPVREEAVEVQMAELLRLARVAGLAGAAERVEQMLVRQRTGQ